MYCELCNGYNGEHSLTCPKKYKIEQPQRAAGKCTCGGQKFGGGSCSDWCDSRKPAQAF